MTCVRGSSHNSYASRKDIPHVSLVHECVPGKVESSSLVRNLFNHTLPLERFDDARMPKYRMPIPSFPLAFLILPELLSNHDSSPSLVLPIVKRSSSVKELTIPTRRRGATVLLVEGVFIGGREEGRGAEGSGGERRERVNDT